ncbi:hypothetical protein H6P81_015805 [Aristolochia fimbriata]|uniref:Nuclear condensin complex subunit 3 C-terminal domain-containing protein n=1 Tax=Aristolochia fimbriata TaxID=158543 RepID=A0AAV7E6K9_ARIFI|nr:hypothetical protein H6P81_015805 [Aristolochia fimbriata]
MVEMDFCLQVSQILNDCRHSYAVQRRKIKELAALQSSAGLPFFAILSKALIPLFDFPRRTASAERVMRFVAIFVTRRNEKNPSLSDAFLEEFMRFLLLAANAASKNARFRACQIISEIIMRLPDDAEVSDEIWDEVIDNMKQKVDDKVPSVRTFAVRSLARFAVDAENGGDIVDLFLEALSREPKPEVRKAIVLSLPPSSLTSVAIVERTLDVNESVRRASYCVLANKFPIQSLSIKQRTVVLQRGLADRSLSVIKECLKLLKDEWLTKGCGGDCVALLRFLDVETYEQVGEAVMDALLKAGMINLQDGQGIKQFLVSTSEGDEGQLVQNVQMMEAEVALYWRTICRYLQIEAQAKGSDAAATGGTEAAVYAAEASEKNDLLDKILPSTVSDYVDLVKTHLDAGPNYRFTSRQLLLLGTMLDFSDATNRKLASVFVLELLVRPLDHEVEDDGNKILIGDGINLGGDKHWARAVSELVQKVHASAREFDEVLTGVIDELARPCRERTADFLQWMHCLAVTSLYLENVKSLQRLKQKNIDASEILHALLIPGVRHIHVDVQRAAVRCLGLFGLREKKPSSDLVKQLRLSYLNGPNPVRIMASKALLDLGMWHGPEVVDRAIGITLSSSHDEKKSFTPLNLSEISEDPSIELLDLLYSGLDSDDFSEDPETDDHETVSTIIGEGFAKVLLLSESYSNISASLHPLILGRLIKLYFSNESKDLHRLKQGLYVFFEHYAVLSEEHKKCISRAFIPVMRSMWPGIFGNPGGAPMVISAQRKIATQASRFMLQMLQRPLYVKEPKEDQETDRSTENLNGSTLPSLDIDSGEEGLAIRIAAEVVSCEMKKTSAGKSYMLALSKIAVLLSFRSSEQVAVKCMRGLLLRMIDSVSADKELLKELMQMEARLKILDELPDEEISQDQLALVQGHLELDANLDDIFSTQLPPTPAPRTTRTATRRRMKSKDVSSDEDDVSSVSAVQVISSAINARSERRSKCVALNRIASRREADDEDEENESDITTGDTTVESE